MAAIRNRRELERLRSRLKDIDYSIKVLEQVLASLGPDGSRLRRPGSSTRSMRRTTQRKPRGSRSGSRPKARSSLRRK